MPTEVIQVNSVEPDAAAIARAAAVLRQGGLVAFPTETVYGLGANALDANAVARIFAAKGRPPINPIIVHVTDAIQAQQLATAWPDSAQRLADRFWPGPLTLVLPRREIVPDIVTAGGPTVGLRVPAHSIARALLAAADVPIAAPSANPSTGVSATRAEHVLRGLGDRIDLLLDGGPTSGGLESTVLDLTTTPARLLRPGLITAAEIEAVIGPVARRGGQASAESETLRSPGLLARHYAPRTVLECVEEGSNRAVELCRLGLRVGWLAFGKTQTLQHEGLFVVLMERDPARYAADLYAQLHALDEAGVDRIVVTLPPDSEAWTAVRDRLRRASSP
ncbi:MAG: threonylcarbamoyl-AMP synthase [Gemmataceae bacterium]|nr:threonylcarbamoyl-AMP synthase [Gemmataceae bacterium]